MRAVVQRVREADVTVEGSVTGAIERGLMVLLGVGYGETTEATQDIWRIRSRVSGYLKIPTER